MRRVILVILLLLPTFAVAQTWTSAVNGNWSTGTNWSGGVAPTSGPTTSLTFTNPFSTTYVATNDIGAFTVNALTLNNAANAAINITNGAAASLAVGGTNPTITVSGPGPATIGGTSLDVSVATVIQGAGIGALSVTSQLTGSGDILLNRSTADFLGTTSFNPLVASSHTGGFTLLSGHLAASAAASSFGTGTILIRSTGVGLDATGTFRALANTTIPNAVSINASADVFNVVTGSAVTLSGGVTGSGSVVVGDGVGTGPTNLTLTGINNYAGSTTINSNFLILTGSGPFGTLGGSSALNVNRLGTLTLGATTTFNTDRISASIAVALNGGTIALVGSTTALNDINEDLGTVTATGFPTLSADAQPNTGTAFTVANLVRANRGVIRLRGDALGTAAYPTANVGNILLTQINGAAPATALVGGGGAAGTTNRSIIPWVVAASTAVGAGDNFATYDAATGVRPLNATTEVLARVAPVTYANPTGNYRLANPSPAGNVPTTVNSLALVTTVNSGVYGLGGAPPVMTVTSGAVLASVNSHVGPLTFPGEGVVTAIANGLVINGPIVAAQGVTFNGTGDVVLTTASPGLTGPITLNGGGSGATNFSTLVITAQNQLGSPSSVTLNGGTLSFRGWTDTLSTNLVVGPLGGGLRANTIGASNSGSPTARSTTLTYSGNLTGSGPLFLNGNAAAGIGGGGAIALTGTNTGYSGLPYIVAGSVLLDSDARLGTNPRAVLGLGATTQATLQPTASFATNRAFTLAGNAEFNVTGALTLTLNGPINNTAAFGVIKSGPGTLLLTNVSTHAGATTLGGELGRTSAGGSFNLSGNGALARTSGATIFPGSVLRLDNTAVNSNNRVNDVNVNLAGGVLFLLGNTAGTTETLGQLSLAANSGGGVLVQPGSPVAPSSRLVFNTGAAVSPFTRAAGSTVVFGSNTILGSAATGQGEIRFVNVTPTTPALVNNVLVGAFGFDSTGGGLVGLATQSPGVVSVRPLVPADNGTLGVQLNFTGSTATSNVILTAPQSSTVTAANAVALNPNVIWQNNAAITLTTGNLSLGPNANVNGSGSIAADVGQDLSLFNPSTTGAATVAVPLSAGTGTLSKTGDGLLNLQAATPALTTVNVHAGNLSTFGPGSFVSLAALNVQAGATFSQAVLLSADQLNGTGAVTLGAATLTVGAANGSSNFGGTLTAGGLTKSGTGTFRFTHTFNYAGPISVTGGTLAFGENSATGPAIPTVSGGAINFDGGTTLFVNGVTTFARAINVNTGTVELDNGGQGGATTFTGPIAIAAGATLNVNTTTSGGFRFNGVVSGAGSLVIGTGSLNLNGANTHAGGTTLNSTTGFVLIGNDSALGTGPLTVAATSFVMPTGGNRTLSNAVNLNANVTIGPSAGIETAANPFNLTFTGVTTLGGAAGSRTVATTGAGNYTLSTVTDGTATGLIKAGGGTLTLAGASPYSGITAVTAGTLIVNGTKTGTGAVTVGNAASGAAAVLAGSGSVAGVVTVQPTGIVAPGNSVGTLTLTGGVAMQAGSTYLWELQSNATTAGQYDVLAVTGGTTTIDPAALFVPSFIGTATAPSAIAFWQSPQTWMTVLQTSGGGTFVIDNAAWATLGTFATIPSALGVSLQWTPVPEPTHLLAVAALGAAWQYWRRGRK